MQPPLAAIEQFLFSTKAWKKAKLGIVTNQAATTASGMPTMLALQQAGFKVATLFSPEHGFTTTGADGESQPDGKDAASGIPLVSLYGQRIRPSAEHLAGLDALVFDIPDVGCRFYTYLWTMTHCMEACAEVGLPLIVLDRPNPLGGDFRMAEGPWLDETHCASFIGRWNIPVRHSCTLGELARYFAATRMPQLQLEVMPCSGWQREHSFFKYPHWFRPTSPAIQQIESAMFFPGTGFWEGINVHEGRGTAHPFRQMGAPWVDSGTLLYALLDTIDLPGIQFSAITYTPTSGRYTGQICHGIRGQITDELLFRPVRTGIQILQCLKKTFPHHLKEVTYPTAANPGGGGHLDKLTGVAGAFEKLDDINFWKDELNLAEWWRNKMDAHLIYH